MSTTSRVESRHACWLGTFLLLPLFALACDEPAGGERGSMTDDCRSDWLNPCDDGVAAPCPAGEECSDALPTGLWFGGARLGESLFGRVVAPGVTAVGGQQRIWIYTDSSADRLIDVPFLADVRGDAFTISETSEHMVRIEGVRWTSGTLRILDAENGRLFDRIQLSTAQVDRVVVKPMFLNEDDEEITMESTLDVTYYAGVEHALVVAFYSVGGKRLIDDGLLMELPDGWQRGSWDGIVTVDPLAPGTHSVSITLSDGTEIETALRSVERVDDIVWIARRFWDTPPTDGVPLGGSGKYCFRATNGDAAVVGMEWSSAASSHLTVRGDLSNCVVIRGEELGTGQVSITAGNLTRVFAVPVYQPARAAPMPVPMRGSAASLGPQPGTRAAAR